MSPIRPPALIVLSLATCLGFTSTVSSAILLADPFAGGGTTPGPGQYQSDPASTNGVNNDSIAGQGPTLPGFSGSTWSGGNFISSIYGQIADGGLHYEDGFGNKVNRYGTPHHLRFARGINASVTRNTSRGTLLNGPMTNYTPGATGIYVAALMRYDAVGTQGVLRLIQGGSRALTMQINGAGELLVGSNFTFNAGPKNMGSLTPGQTHLVVLHFFENNRLEVWVNPTDLANNPAPDFSGADPGPGYVGSNGSFGLETINIRFPGGNAGDVFEVDEIRVATSFIEAVNIPEPTSLAFLALGALAAMRRGRMA